MKKKMNEEGLISKQKFLNGIEGDKNYVEEYTTIQNPMLLFNLQNDIDYKINECVGEIIKVKDVYMKKINKKYEKGLIKEINGEKVEINEEHKLITILIDEEGKSYITGSKKFGYNMMKLINYFGEEKIKEGILIKIIKKPVPGSQFQALSFMICN